MSHLARSWNRLPADVRRAILIALILRFVLGLMGWIVATWFPGYPEHAVWAGQRPAMQGLSGPLLAPFERDDSAYYLAIAHGGYSSAGLTAFFPLFPLTIAGLGTVLAGAYLFAGLVISTVAFVCALVLFGRLALELCGDRRARFAVCVFAVWPFTWYFLMPLTESTFLALSLGCFFALRRQHIGAASGLALLAALTRLQGAFLALPILIVAMRDTQSSWARRGGRASWCLLPLAATALFYWYIADIRGFSGGFTAGQAGWHQQLTMPWKTVADSFLSVGGGGHPEELVNLVMVLIAAACLPAIRRFGAEYFAYVLVSLLVIVFKEGGTTPLISAVRFIAVLFPVQLAIANLLHDKRLLIRVAMPALALLQVATFVTDVRFVWVG